MELAVLMTRLAFIFTEIMCALRNGEFFPTALSNASVREAQRKGCSLAAENFCNGIPSIRPVIFCEGVKGRGLVNFLLF